MPGYSTLSEPTRLGSTALDKLPLNAETIVRASLHRFDAAASIIAASSGWVTALVGTPAGVLKRGDSEPSLIGYPKSILHL